MLAEKNIFAMSPSIGSSNIYTQTYFITQESALVEMLSQNYDWINYTIKSILPHSTFNVKTFTTTLDETEWSATVDFMNQGLTDVSEHNVRFLFNTTLFPTIELLVDG